MKPYILIAALLCGMWSCDEIGTEQFEDLNDIHDLPDSSSVLLYPGAIQAVVGDTVDLRISLFGVQQISGFQARITYDFSMLDFLDAEQGLFLRQIQNGPNLFITEADQISGSLMIYTSLLSDGSAVELGGSGEIAIIRFSVRQEGNCVVLIDSNQTFFSDSEGNPGELMVSGSSLITIGVQP